ncbi:MAG: sugar-binding domain-containing protein, partial [Draconibacterium sp.]
MIRNRFSKIISVTVVLCLYFTIHIQANTVNEKNFLEGESPRLEILFDNDWRFHRGGAQRAEMPDFDDSNWRIVDLPHDWSIEDLSGTESPFHPDAISQVGGGFTVGGTGWYRKSFNVPSEQKGKRITILFEGVYMNAEFWLNGELLGDHP